MAKHSKPKHILKTADTTPYIKGTPGSDGFKFDGFTIFLFTQIVLH
jgi:hypothetical protein